MANTYIDGGVSEWQEWGDVTCDQTCGVNVTGTRTRLRSCDNPLRQGNGKTCVEQGLVQQELSRILCDNIPESCAKVDGGVSEWGEWDTPRCPTCGENVTGVSLRLRSCFNPVPANGRSFCTEPVQEIVVRSCEVARCPVQLQLSPLVGYHSAVFESRPTDSQWELNRDREQEEVSYCSRSVVTGVIMLKLRRRAKRVDGGFSEWGEWSNPDCPVTCGREAKKMVSRNRNCTEPPPLFGGANCTGPSEESTNRSCNNTECPIDGGFSEWVEWSNPDCPVTCGREAEKIVSRNRSCTEPSPLFGGANCTGPSEESTNRSCNNTECPIDGGFSEWVEWSNPDCPVTCGREAEKIVSRNRSCTEPPPLFGGANCTGPSEESTNRSCNNTECPIDGGFSEWVEWSNPDCPVTCGREAEKIVSRNRSCTEPPPLFGGANCTGPSEESTNRSCNNTECPIDGGFSEWVEWSNPDCPVTCGREAEKIVSRNRSCTEPPPLFGGANCTGPSEESTNRSCNNTECPS
ncbi:coadhesin-like [Haliotis cracherodii]|uniref:coadhesin-like n=1 Tax=Haliotis cracherodii TaxID=6455 RepID=UPI0039E73AAA